MNEREALKDHFDAQSLDVFKQAFSVVRNIVIL
jgi:hypothetical protein